MTQSDPTQGIAATFAHELVGPMSSVGHSLELMAQQWQVLMSAEELACWRAGVNAKLMETPRITTKAPAALPAKLARRYASATSKNIAVAELLNGLNEAALERALKFFELGYSYKCAQLGIGASQSILKNLRNWGDTKSSQTIIGVSIEETLQTAWLLVQSRAKNVDISWELAPCEAITANPHALTQVWMNLLMNASQVNADGTKVKISAVVNERTVKITFQNSGLALPEGLALFEQGATARKGGSGIGLHVCRKIVLEHGGQISARNGTPDGAIFEVELPLK